MKKMFKDEKALSPVIGEILIIAMVAILAAIVAAYAYNIIDSATDVSSATIIIEGAEVGSSYVKIVHMGGERMPNAFTPSFERFVNESVFNNLEVKINGAIYEGDATLNSGAIAKPDFATADELALKLDHPLSAGDVIRVIYVPGGQIMREFDVW